MARAPDVWRIACPRCNTGRVLAGDGAGGSAGFDEPFAVHDCFTCQLPAEEIARWIAVHGLPEARDESDYGTPRARTHYIEELARCERAFGPGHLATARCHVALGRNFGDYMEGRGGALQHYRAAWAIHVAGTAGAPDHPVWLMLAAKLGYELKCTSGYQEALPCYQLLRQGYERLLGPTHLALADTWRLVGDVALAAGDPATARGAYERELAMWTAATDDAIASAARDQPAIIRTTSFALYPLDRDTNGDYRAHQCTITGAKLAIALDRLGLDEVPRRVFGELSAADAERVGDYLFQSAKQPAAARWFFAHALSLADPSDYRTHGIRAKLQMAQMLGAR